MQFEEIMNIFRTAFSSGTLSTGMILFLSGVALFFAGIITSIVTGSRFHHKEKELKDRIYREYN